MRRHRVGDRPRNAPENAGSGRTALRYLADQTEVQTAALMGCSTGTVKSQTHAAMEKLRDVLTEREEDR